MHLRHSFTLLGILGALGAAGCSGDDDDNGSGGAGGSSGSTGGSSAATGGSNAATGGSSAATGGSGAVGGSAGAGTGGSAGTGASSGKGGSGGTGGSAAGTGGTGGFGAGAPDIDYSTPTDELTMAEKGELCDWTQGLRGGYGMTVDCGHQKFVSTFDNQEECLTVGFLHSSCDPTAAMWSACQLALVPDDGCVTPPECLAISEC